MRRRSRQPTTSTTRPACPSRALRGPLVALALAALVLFPTVQGDAPTEIVGDLLATSIAMRGDVRLGPASLTAALVPPAPDLAVRWTIAAEELQVNKTTQSRLELAHPTREETLFSTSPEPSNPSQERFAQAYVSSRVRQGGHLLVAGLPGGSPTVDAAGSEVAIASPGARTWMAGSQTPGTISRTNPTGTWIEFPLAADVPEATFAGARMTVHGDFFLVVWETDVQVEGKDGPTTFTSGRHVEPVTPGTRKSVYELLVLEARNATLEVSLTRGRLLLASTDLDAAASGVASLESAVGSVRHSGGSFDAFHERVEIEGDFHISARDAPADPDKLRLHLQVANGDVQLPWSGQQAANVPVVAPSTALPWRWGLLALGVGGLFGVGYLGRRPIEIDQVEQELIFGDPDRACRMARRLVRRAGGSPDALFLYATALVATGRHKESVKRIEPLAALIPVALRCGVAFALAASARALGDLPRQRRWAEEAARDPLLRRRMREQGLLDKAVVERRFTAPAQTGYS